jgi:hypothetical protein
MRKTSGLAITSLVLGILSLLCCGAGILAGIPAIITGHIANSRVKSNPETQSGAGLALAGLIMGYLSIVIAIVAVPLAIPAFSGGIAGAKAAIALTNERAIYLASEKANVWPADAGITSSAAYIDALIKKNVLTKEAIPMFRAEDFQFANVSGGDPGETIFARTRPGIFTNGSVAVFYKNGNGQIYKNEAAVKGAPPAREPRFLTD